MRTCRYIGSSLLARYLHTLLSRRGETNAELFRVCIPLVSLPPHEDAESISSVSNMIVSCVVRGLTAPYAAVAGM